MASAKDLERLTKAFQRLADADEGTRHGAANAIRDMCQRMNIDIRDVHLSDKGSANDPLDHITEMRDMMEEHQIDRQEEVHRHYEQRLSDENKALQDRLTRLLAGNATLKLVKKTRKTRETAELRLQLDDAVERIKLLEAQPHGPALVADLQVELEITSARADAFEKEMEASRIELNATLTKLEIAQEACRTSGVHGQQSD